MITSNIWIFLYLEVHLSNSFVEHISMLIVIDIKEVLNLQYDIYIHFILIVINSNRNLFISVIILETFALELIVINDISSY